MSSSDTNEETIASLGLPISWDCHKLKMGLNRYKRVQLKASDVLAKNIRERLEFLRLHSSNGRKKYRDVNRVHVLKVSQYMNVKNALQFELEAKAYALENSMNVEDCVEYLWYPLYHRELPDRYFEEGFNYRNIRYPDEYHPDGVSRTVKLGTAFHLLRNPFCFLPLDELEHTHLFPSYLLCRCLVGKRHFQHSMLMTSEYETQKNPPPDFNSAATNRNLAVALFSENHILPEFFVSLQIDADSEPGPGKSFMRNIQFIQWTETSSFQSSQLMGLFETGRQSEIGRQGKQGKAKIFVRSIPNHTQLESEKKVPGWSIHYGDEPYSRHPSDDIFMDPLGSTGLWHANDFHHGVHNGAMWLRPMEANKTKLRDIFDLGRIVQHPAPSVVRNFDLPIYRRDNVDGSRLTDFFRNHDANENVINFRDFLQRKIRRIPDEQRRLNLPLLSKDQRLEMMQLLMVIHNEVRPDMQPDIAHRLPRGHANVYYQFVRHPIVRSYITNIEKQVNKDLGRKGLDVFVQAVYMIRDKFVWSIQKKAWDLMEYDSKTHAKLNNERVAVIPIMGNYGLVIEDLGFKLPTELLDDESLLGTMNISELKNRAEAFQELLNYSLRKNVSIRDWSIHLFKTFSSDTFLPFPILTKGERQNVIDFVQQKQREYTSSQETAENTLMMVQYLLFHDSVWLDFEERYKASKAVKFGGFTQCRLTLLKEPLATYPDPIHHGTKGNFHMYLPIGVRPDFLILNNARYVIRVSELIYIDFHDAGFDQLDYSLNIRLMNPPISEFFRRGGGGLEFLDDVMTESIENKRPHVSVIKRYLSPNWTIPSALEKQFLEMERLDTKYEGQGHPGYDVSNEVFNYVTPDRLHILKIPYAREGGITIPFRVPSMAST